MSNTIIFMCGLPEVGKQYYAKRLFNIFNNENYKSHIFFFDDIEEGILFSLMNKKVLPNITSLDIEKGIYDEKVNKTLEFIDRVILWLRTRSMSANNLTKLSDDNNISEPIDILNKVAIINSCNMTKNRRKLLKDKCDESNIKSLFVEIKCTNRKRIENNLAIKMKSCLPNNVYVIRKKFFDHLIWLLNSRFNC